MEKYRRFYRMITVITVICTLIAALAAGGGIATASAASKTYQFVHTGSLAGKTIGTYTGDLKNGMAHGNGTLNFDYGATYKGKFEYGYPCGYGTYTYEDGTKVSGNWYWGRITGSLDSSRKGTALSYQGMIRDGDAYGYGEMTLEKCGTFYGEFYNGNVDGWGVYAYKSPVSKNQTLKDGYNWKMVYGSNKHDHRYTGLTLNGSWQGYGIGVKKNGSYYVGEIYNEYRSGYGRVFMSGGSLHQEGIFQNGKLAKSK